MGGGLTKSNVRVGGALKRSLKNEIIRLRRGADDAPVVILAAHNLHEEILKYVRSDVVAETIFKMAGTEALLKCIRIHRDEPAVLRAAVPLLLLLCRTASNARLAQQRGMAEILSASDAEIERRGDTGESIDELRANIEQAIALIRGMYAPGAAMKKAIENDDVESIAFLLKYSNGDPKIATDALVAILDWCQVNSRHRDTFVKLYTHRHVIAVMVANQGWKYPKLQANGAGCLCELARDPGACREIGRFGGITALAENLRTLPLPVEVHQQCLWALNTLCNIPENVSRMKEAKFRLLMNEVKTRTVKDVVDQRDRRQRRGEEARESTTWISPKAGATADPLREPALFVPRRLRNIKWEDVEIIHVSTYDPLRKNPVEKQQSRIMPGSTAGKVTVLDTPAAFGMRMGKKVHKKGLLHPDGESSESEQEEEDFREKDPDDDDGGLEILPDGTIVSKADKDKDKDKAGDEGEGGKGKKTRARDKSKKAGDAFRSGSHSGEEDDELGSTDSDSSDDELAGLTKQERERIKKMRASKNGPKFDEYLASQGDGTYDERKVDLREQLRKIEHMRQGRHAWGGAYFSGPDFLEDKDRYKDDDLAFDEDEANEYDIEPGAPMRRDPYEMAMQRQLDPDQVEKYFDEETQTVRVRRRFTIVEKHTRLNWRLQKTVVPYQLKYHTGPGGVDPSKQETYPVEAVLKNPDAAILAGPEHGKGDTEPARSVQSPLFPASAFSGLFRR